MKRFMVLLLLAAATNLACGKTIGLWKDARSGITEGMLTTLQEAGWQTTILTNKDLSSEAKLTGLDVIFLPGGWNAYDFADFQARRNLIRYVAGGKGILAGAFRSGYVRTSNRPIFPQVGAVYNRVNGPYISAYGDSDLARAIDKPFCPGGWDHLVVKVGPLGKVFAVNGDDPVGVYGDVYGGRYVVFGAFLGADAKSNSMQGTERQVLLKSVDWLGAAPKLNEADKAKQEAQADLDFLRREKSWDWTLNERGPDSGSGILPKIHNALAMSLESRQFTLEYMSQYLSGKQLDACQAAAGELKNAMTTLDGNFQKALAEITGKIEKMSLVELTTENPLLNKSNVLARIKAAVVKTDVEEAPGEADSGKAKSAGLNEKAVAELLHGGEYSEKLMPAGKLKELTANADKTISELRPMVKAAKAAKLAEERKQDLASVPGLIKQCASPDVALRRTAIKELGRIGDPKTAPTLIQALKDADEIIRIDSILGLGWMQSKEAVPALLALLESRDVRTTSRTLQALGQIGDERATPAIVTHVRNPHPFLAENAIMSAGWLKIRTVVPELLKIVSDGDPNIGEQRALMYAALRALGHIGNSSALPQLEAIAAKIKDFPQKRDGGPIANIYATPQGLGIKHYCELAMAEIKAGGLTEPGLKQPDFLASKDAFYALSKNFNALAGRPGALAFAEDGKVLMPYLVEAGLTGIHGAWGSENANPDKYERVIEEAGEFGLRWIDVLPINFKPYRVPYYKDNPQSGVDKAAADLILAKFRDMPAFTGFWSEETYPGIKATSADFETWLVKKYGADYRKTLGVGSNVVIPSNAQQFRELMNAVDHPLKTPCLEFGADRIREYWGETQDWLSGMRKGCIFTFSVSGQHFSSYIGLTGPVGNTIAVNGPESYQCFGRDNAFLMEMYKNGEARPVMCEFYNWYTPSEAHAIRGFAQHLMHGECFYNFALEHIFKYSDGRRWTWDASRWNGARKIFKKAGRIKEYLAVPDSAANVAQLCSERTAAHFNDRSSLSGRWYQQQAALWTALQQSQIPTDVIWAENMTPEKLSRYNVVVMTDAKMLTDVQAGMIRDWVNKGGILIAGGSSTLFDQLPAAQKNYMLADVFGVDYAGFAGVADPALNDTTVFQQGRAPAPVASGMELPAAGYHVHRDIKPVKSIGAYKITDKTETSLPGIAPGTACEYDMPLGYDKVKPGAAGTLAAFANGDPALTMNKIGKGLCYFWTPIHPGLCHVASEWEMQPNKYDFWPNVRELLTAMVKGGLAQQKMTLPVDVTGVSKEVEVTVRQQPGQNRWMIHLLDYDTKSTSVKGAVMTVHPPTGKTVKRIFHPDTDTEVKFVATDKGVTANLREFEAHDMVVVEWK